MGARLYRSSLPDLKDLAGLALDKLAHVKAHRRALLKPARPWKISSF